VKSSFLIALGVLMLAFFGLAIWKRVDDRTRTSRGQRPTDSGERAQLVHFWERYNHASRLRTAGKFQKAAEHYRAALSIDPNHEESIYYLGNCLFEVGDYIKALRWFERLIHLNPASQRGHSQIGVVTSLLAPGAPLNYQRAVQALERNLELDPEESGSFLRLGHIALEQDQLPKAYELFSKAAGFSSPEGMFWAGFVRFQQGRYREAADQFRKVIELADRERLISSRGAASEGDIAEDDDAAEPTPLQKAELKSRIFLYWSGLKIGDGNVAAAELNSRYLELNILQKSRDRLIEGLKGRLLNFNDASEDVHRLISVSPNEVIFIRQRRGADLDFEQEQQNQEIGGGWNAFTGDVDQDGRNDLYVVQSGFWGTGQNRLYLSRTDQEGRLVWEEVTDAYGLSGERPTVAACFSDVDGDGRLDLIEAGNSSPDYSALRLFRGGPKGFSEARSVLPEIDGNATDLAVADFDADGWPDVLLTRWKRPPLLLRNNGDGSFVQKQPEVLSRVPGTALSCAVFDYDQDQRPDLLIGERSDYETALKYLVQDEIQPLKEGTILIFRNQGDWKFQDVTAGVGLARYPGAVDLIPADLNNDGWPDLLVVNGGPSAYWRIPSQILINQKGRRFALVAMLPGFLPVGAMGAAIILHRGERTGIALPGVGLFEFPI